MNNSLANSSSETSMRLDKWLWCARFFKSRQLAVTAVKSQNVTVNGNRAKPSRSIVIGDYLVIDKKGIVFEVEIIGLSSQRLSAPLVGKLYRETSQSLENRQQRAELRKLDRLARIQVPRHKPDKRSRRQRAKLKRSV